MKTNIHFSPVLIAIASIVVLLIMACAPFSSQAANSDLLVQDVVAAPYNASAFISWSELSGEFGEPVVSYEVFYGLSSVEEGLVESYDDMASVVGSENSVALSDLSNGVRYFVSVQASFEGGDRSDLSREVVVTPSSVYSELPSTEVDPSQVSPEDSAIDSESPVVEEALALTKNIIKISFSEEVSLPEILPELSFSITESADASLGLSVVNAEYKVDYADSPEEIVYKDIVFLTSEEDMNPDAEYIVTVSAAIADLSGNPIDSGVTDFALFAGTDAEEIPVSELPLVAPEAPIEDLKPAAPEGDVSAPENVSDFTINAIEGDENFLLNLEWKKSSSDDVDHQDVYKSEDDGSAWDDEAELDAFAEKYSTSASPESELAYKVTATDDAGNENAGAIQSVRVPALTATGAPLALVSLGSLFGLAGIRRFRKK